MLDLGLPGKNGLDILRDLRKTKVSTPVIILTARDAVKDRISELDSSADDYLVKPFNPDELVARIRALLRRRDGRVDSFITFGPLVLNMVTHELYCQERPITLSLREFSLLSPVFGIPETTSVSIALIMHGTAFFPVILAGLYYLWKNRLSLDELKKAGKAT